MAGQNRCFHAQCGLHEDYLRCFPAAFFSGNALIGYGGGGRLHRMILDFLLQIRDRRLELGVLSHERRVRQVVHHDVGIDAVALDQPGALRAVDAELRRRGDALVHQEIVAVEPDFAAPRARADHLAELQAA